jgi:pyridoxamine 5'-phosphate oxidase
MLFYWKTCQRQIRIEGSTERVSEAEADSYFATRPRESQIGAWASAQSRPLGQYEDLQESVVRYTAQFKDRDVIPRPPHWSGYRLIPHAVEFWVEGEFRLHRRFLYRRNAADWQMVLLNP